MLTCELQGRERKMIFSYGKLWCILIERKMMKTDLIKKAKISTNAMAKMVINEGVRLEVLAKICIVLGCKLDDIVDFRSEDGE